MSMIPADYVLLGSEEILTIGLASCLYGNQINPNAPKLTLTCALKSGCCASGCCSGVTAVYQPFGSSTSSSTSTTTSTQAYYSTETAAVSVLTANTPWIGGLIVLCVFCLVLLVGAAIAVAVCLARRSNREETAKNQQNRSFQYYPYGQSADPIYPNREPSYLSSPQFGTLSTLNNTNRTYY